MTLLALLLPVNILLTWLASRRSPFVARVLPGSSGPLVLTLVLVLGLLSVSAELLSLVSAVGPGGLAVVQVLWLAGATALLVARRGRDETVPLDLQRWVPTRPVEVGGLVLAVAVIVVMIASGVFNQITTNDSLTYHLPRVLHWLDNGTVWHYEAVVQRQVWQPPLSGYLLLPVMGLTASDGFAWLVQFGAYLASVLLVLRVTEQLGGDRRARFWAGLLAATVPLSVLQATTAQHDLVAAVVFLVCVTLVLGDTPDRRGLGWVVLLGAAFGAAILMKGSLWPLVLPLGAYLAIRRLRTGGTRTLVPLVAAGLVALVMAGPFLLRNVAEFDSITGPHSAASKSTAHPGIIASNMLRNAALQFSTPSTDVNEAVVTVVRGAHAVIGMDPDDQRGMLGQAVFYLPYGWNNEGSAGAPVHAVVVLVAVGGVLAAGRRRWSDPTSHLVTVVAVGFVALSALLPFMRWNSRLLLPLLLTLLPVAAVWSMELPARPRRVFRGVGGVLACVLAGAVLAFPTGRQLVGTDSIVVRSDAEELRAAGRPFDAELFDVLRSELAAGDCKVVGLVGDETATEYLVWWALEERWGWLGGSVEPSTDGVFDADPLPCLVVSMQVTDVLIDVVVGGQPVEPDLIGRGHAVYRP